MHELALIVAAFLGFGLVVLAPAGGGTDSRDGFAQ